jgi:Ni2+-binding GTPase involved in maturation of urease and hydrogenase
MKLIIVGGPPSVGKTSVLIHCIKNLYNFKKKVAVVKLDCLFANDTDVYSKHQIKSIVGLSTYICPDHFLASNIERIVKYGGNEKLDYIIVESAGLCNRCSPHIRDNLGVTVLNMISGIHAPKKIGPMLKSANVLVLTGGDLVSQAEREVFKIQCSKINRKARIIEVNGLSGQNSKVLAKLFSEAPDFDSSVPLHLKFTMPGAVCSFCLGEQRVGETFASGNVKLMEIPGIK